MNIIKLKNVRYKIKIKDENNEIIEEKAILDDINIDIEKGDFIAVLGHNGSGKSTFAKHLNALLLPDDGNVYIDGEDTKSVEELWKIREKCGMVFQNPDNQIVGVTVEEDVGFGPENLGVDSKKIWTRVNASLTKVGMYRYRKKSPNHLSGGQKQRVAIASSLAMQPKCIVLDEATAMLDPQGRKEVMNIIQELNKKEDITVIFITHHMNEAVRANKVFVIDNGRIALQGTPAEVFSDVEKIKKLRLDMPQVMELSYELYKRGIFERFDILTMADFVEEFKKNIKKCVKKQFVSPQCALSFKHSKEQNSISNHKEVLLKLENINLIYEPGTSMEVKALDNISIDIYDDEFIGIIGHTGSGKSSLVQVMNGLIKTTSGDVIYRGKNIQDKDFNRKKLHCDVGLVFQYPESQLFEETVLKDVMFGPINKGMTIEEAETAAKEALQMLDLDSSYYEKSPFELSGGEKRRVAIAGIFAMNPDVIILDEPTAGLDPVSARNLLDSLKDLKENKSKTIVIVSHSMEDMANYVERLIVMNNGKVVFDDKKREVFKKVNELEKIGLDVPDITKLMKMLNNNGYVTDRGQITVEEALNDILKGTDINA